MAAFTDDETSRSRLDYELLRFGGVVLFSDAVLDADLARLRSERYEIHDFDATSWRSEEDFHDAVAQALGFPGYYGRNLDAFNDCMGDVEVPVEGGMAILIRGVDAVRAREGRFLTTVVDILAGTARGNLLFGRRLLTLLQSRDPAIQLPPVGAVPVLWNRRERFDSDRGL